MYYRGPGFLAVSRLNHWYYLGYTGKKRGTIWDTLTKTWYYLGYRKTKNRYYLGYNNNKWVLSGLLWQKIGYTHKYWYYLGYTNKNMGTICMCYSDKQWVLSGLYTDKQWGTFWATLTKYGSYLGYTDKKCILSVLQWHNNGGQGVFFQLYMGKFWKDRVQSHIS